MRLKLLTIFALLQFSDIAQVHCDFYTSIASLEDLLESEIYILEAYENYLKSVETTNKRIISFLEKVESDIKTIQEDRKTYFGNPINAFKALKRFGLDWQTLEDIILSNDNVKDYTRKIKKMKELDYASATKDDLIGASKALARLQRTYNLKAGDLAEGVLLDYEYNSTLSAHDCFELGYTLYDANELHYAGQWLLEARLLLQTEYQSSRAIAAKFEISNHFPYLSDVSILEHLAPNMFDTGNKKMAKIFNEELLSLDPQNKYGLSNKALFEGEVMQTRRTAFFEDKENQAKEEQPSVDTLYEAVCRGEVKQTAKEQRNLRCRYTSRDMPFYRLAPFKMEVFSHDPLIVFYYDAIYDNEMEKIIETAEDSMERSEIGDDEDALYSDERTSKNTWLDFAKHKFLSPIKQRLQDITGLNFDHAEQLQVVNYGIGGHYMPHDDFSENAELDYKDQGNRVATALFFINDVELGGATAFPFLKLAVPPIKGGLLVWYNLHESLEPDYRNRHAGCPVIKGSKWICNEWFHERGQELTRPCSLEQNGVLSSKLKDVV